MSLFDKICSDENDYGCLREYTYENGIGIDINANCYNDEALNNEKIIVLKLDEYHDFCSLYTPNPPSMVDFLILTECCDSSLDIFIVEIRQTANARRSTQRLKPKDIVKKFENAVELYLEKKASRYLNDRVIRKVKAYLVCDPWGNQKDADGEEIFRQKAKGSCLDAYNNLKPIKVFNHFVMIEPILPNPVIECC